MPSGEKTNKLFTLVLFMQLFLPASTNVYGQIDYSESRISLLTYSPGEKLYSVFGHSAIRVKGKETDWVYNYGTFDFDDPNFYLEFVKGNLNYRLSRLPFNYVYQMNKEENRSLIETPLRFSGQQKIKVIQQLKIDYLPENRDYRYDFIYNNCATKIIDVINFGTSNLTVYNPLAVPQTSFRRLLDPYLTARPWTHTGIDFLMGMPADKPAEGTESSFLPDYLHLLVKNAKVASLSGSKYELSHPDIIHFQSIHKKPGISLKPEWMLWPLVLICIISLIFDSYFFAFFIWLYKILLLGFGILGLLLLVLWTTTNHYIFNFNTDILWANPLLISTLFITKGHENRSGNKIRQYYLILVFLLASVGSLTTILIEKNLNLLALSFLILTALYDKIKTFQKYPEN